MSSLPDAGKVVGGLWSSSLEATESLSLKEMQWDPQRTMRHKTPHEADWEGIPIQDHTAVLLRKELQYED